MIEIGDFFDTLADRWDEICIHDEAKIEEIMSLATLRPGMRILDVGCGTGVLERFLLPTRPEKIVAVDLSARMIEKAREKYGTPIVDFRCADVMDLTDEPFDLIMAYSVYPHFEDPEGTIRKFSQLLKPGGELLICHSQSRDRINGHHEKNAEKQSMGLPPAHVLAEKLMPFFSIEHTTDNDRLDIVKGRKTQI